MHNSYPQLGHFHPQMGCSDGQMGHFYPQLGFAAYDDAGQMGADIDIGAIVSSALDKAIGVLPGELKNQILGSPLGQQVVQQTSDVAYKLGADQAAAQAATYWTQKQQALQAQFTDILTYTKSNYQKLLTYGAIALGVGVVAYFGWPVVKGLLKPKMAAASNPRRRRRHRRARGRWARRMKYRSVGNV